MAEVTYTAGRNIFASLGKGKAVMGLYITSGSGSDTITTPFARCVPVLTPAVASDATSLYNVTESAGVVTITGGGTQITGYQCVIMGDLY